MKTTLLKHALVSAVASATVVLIAGGIASAHVDADPVAMEAGTTGTVAFIVEHGCDGSPMTSIEFEIPDGVSGVAPVDKDGWTATLTGSSVEFKGGPMAADGEDHCDLTLTAPAQAGEIHFPAIQTCEVGELAWIEIPEEGGAEPERPAPTLKITEGPPTSADLTPDPEEEEATHETSVTDGTVVTLSTTVAAASDDDSSNTGAILAIGIGAVIVLAGGGVLLARRKNAAAKPGSPS